jgi:hypothetical protein
MNHIIQAFLSLLSQASIPNFNLLQIQTKISLVIGPYARERLKLIQIQ